MGDRIMEFIDNNSIKDLVSYLDYILREAEKIHSKVKFKLLIIMLANTPLFIYSLYRVVTLRNDSINAVTIGHLGIVIITMGIYFYTITLKSKKDNLYGIIDATTRYRARIIKVGKSDLDTYGKKSRLYSIIRMYLGSLSVSINMSRRELLKHLQQKDLEKYISKI